MDLILLTLTHFVTVRIENEMDNLWFYTKSKYELLILVWKCCFIWGRKKKSRSNKTVTVNKFWAIETKIF